MRQADIVSLIRTKVTDPVFENVDSDPEKKSEKCGTESNLKNPGFFWESVTENFVKCGFWPKKG